MPKKIKSLKSYQVEFHRADYTVGQQLFSPEETQNLRDYFMNIHINDGVAGYYEPTPLRKKRRY